LGAARQEQILRLDVAVHDADRVSRRERVARLQEKLGGTVDGRCPFFAK
jgi:hypothetical protein